MTEVRTRIEPAPSGSIHVGNARTALYNWLFARHHGGSFILRIADTDAKRATEENYRAVLEDMEWLGLVWDEGPETGGAHGPYRQSERLDLYAEVAEGLRRRGAAYPCYCTAEELAERRKRAQAERATPGYDGRCRDLRPEQIAAFEDEGRVPATRFAVPADRTVSFEDAVLGEVATGTSGIPDFVIQRSDGTPTYMLAVTLDDALMEVSHVIRGNDLVASTPRQLLMREALGYPEPPVFAHLPLIVAEGGKPLSKRWGDVAVRAYRERGFLPEAMVNYLVLLGWSYDDRTNVFSVPELIESFSLDRVGKNPAIFDVAKLEWLNLHYIKTLPPRALAQRVLPHLEAAGIPIDAPDALAKLGAIAPHIVERLRRLDEAPGMVRFLFERAHPDAKAVEALRGQEEYLAAAAAALEEAGDWTAASIESALRALAEERALKPKQAFQPLRAAVTGTLVSPPLFESLEVLGREETLARLRSTMVPVQSEAG